MPVRVLPPSDTQRSWPLHDTASTRALEASLSSGIIGTTLMQRAGLAVARCTLALAPHASRVWIACGSGNNGGDGLEAASHLKRWGKDVWVTWLGDANNCPPDSLAALEGALANGIRPQPHPPETFDFCVDALLGIGFNSVHLKPTPLQTARNDRLNEWITAINAQHAPVLAVDLPSGLNGDTGQLAVQCVQADFTLSLLTLKPGLFTAFGRDVCGEIWLDNLQPNQVDQGGSFAPPAIPPTAWLSGPAPNPTRLHASHKGSYGDVCVVGGGKGMVGAALLAARASARAGAGRTFVALVDEAPLAVDPDFPDLMFREVNSLDFVNKCVVIGCGGGTSVSSTLARAIAEARCLVVDADGLNAIAADPGLRKNLCNRTHGDRATVLTPHPLEAARLLQKSTSDIQKNRLQSAQQLAEQFNCVVLLKGSGTVIAGPRITPCINPTGNAKLATAGTGDVLAGMLGAALATLGPSPTPGDIQNTCAAVAHQHGSLAENWPEGVGMTASDLIRML